MILVYVYQFRQVIELIRGCTQNGLKSNFASRVRDEFLPEPAEGLVVKEFILCGVVEKRSLEYFIKHPVGFHVLRLQIKLVAMPLSGTNGHEN